MERTLLILGHANKQRSPSG